MECMPNSLNCEGVVEMSSSEVMSYKQLGSQSGSESPN